MAYLRFDTDHGRDTVARLRQVVENMRTESESTHSNINALVGSAWVAPAAYEFQSTASELRQSLAGTLERLTELNARLDAEIAEWEETAAVFGGGISGVIGDAFSTGIVAGGRQKPPSTLKGLYEEIESLPSNSPVRIYKVGENDYLILMRGMQINSPTANNSMDALISGLGLPSNYERQIVESIKKTIPPSANINFVAHSQGGIIAQSLADNQDFLKQYHVKTVTTIGSPGTNFNANPDVKYEAYADIADPVPYLNRNLISTIAAGAVSSIAGSLLLSRLSKTMKSTHFVHGSKIFTAAHTGYENTLPDTPISEILGDSIDLDYNDPSGKWDVPHNIMLGKPKDSLSLVSNELFHPQTPIDTFRGRVDVGFEAGKVLGLGAIDTVIVQPTEQLSSTLFPDSGIREAIDGYTDRMYKNVLQSPSVSDGAIASIEGIQHVADKTVTTANEVVMNIGASLLAPPVSSIDATMFGGLTL